MRELNVSKPLDWDAIERVLPSGWRELAVQKKLIGRKLPEQLGAKVKDIGDILRLVLYQVATNSGLETGDGGVRCGGAADHLVRGSSQVDEEARAKRWWPAW